MSEEQTNYKALRAVAAMQSDNNKNKLKEKISEFTDTVIDKAAEDNKIDYFHIEISNHNGNLQMDYKLRDRKKVY